MRKCCAIGCEKAVPDKFLMWPPHWRRVPRHLAARVWDEYQQGQEEHNGPEPTLEYFRAAAEAVDAVALLDGRPLDENQFRRAIAIIEQAGCGREDASDQTARPGISFEKEFEDLRRQLDGRD